MHYMTHKSHQMQKHNFSVTCPDVLFVESVPVPPEHHKLCINTSRSRCTRMHYMTHRSHWMQKYKFGVTCLGVFFVETALGPPEQEK
jgi:hypothetical protein